MPLVCVKVCVFVWVPQSAPLPLTPPSPTPCCSGMERKDWLALCAVHSDAWLMSLAFFYSARFDADGRAELFSLINQHPTVYEVRV